MSRQQKKSASPRNIHVYQNTVGFQSLLRTSGKEAWRYYMYILLIIIGCVSCYTGFFHHPCFDLHQASKGDTSRSGLFTEKERYPQTKSVDMMKRSRSKQRVMSSGVRTTYAAVFLRRGCSNSSVSSGVMIPTVVRL